jgi:hypothetical protein
MTNLRFGYATFVSGVILGICVLALSTAKVYGVLCNEPNSSCVVRNCSNEVPGGADGRPDGCVKVWFRDLCQGKCARCDGSTNMNICARVPEPAGCVFESTNFQPCGNKTKYDCGGVWTQLCNCPDTGGTASNDACGFHFCTNP